MYGSEIFRILSVVFARMAVEEKIFDILGLTINFALENHWSGNFFFLKNRTIQFIHSISVKKDGMLSNFYFSAQLVLPVDLEGCEISYQVQQYVATYMKIYFC